MCSMYSYYHILPYAMSSMCYYYHILCVGCILITISYVLHVILLPYLTISYVFMSMCSYYHILCVPCVLTTISYHIPMCSMCSYYNILPYPMCSTCFYYHILCVPCVLTTISYHIICVPYFLTTISYLFHVFLLPYPILPHMYYCPMAICFSFHILYTRNTITFEFEEQKISKPSHSIYEQQRYRRACASVQSMLFTHVSGKSSANKLDMWPC